MNNFTNPRFETYDDQEILIVDGPDGSSFVYYTNCIKLEYRYNSISMEAFKRRIIANLERAYKLGKKASING